MNPERAPTASLRGKWKPWQPLLVGLAVVGVGILGVQQYRMQVAEALRTEAREELGLAMDLQTAFDGGKLGEKELISKIQAVEKFLTDHPEAEMLSEFPKTRLLLAEIWAKLERWYDAGGHLAKIRPLSGEANLTATVTRAHLLTAESAAPYGHLDEFTKVALAAAARQLEAGGKDPEAPAIRQRLAMAEAHLARHAAQAAWEADQDRLMGINKQAQTKARKLSSTLQKEMQDAFAAVAAQLQSATDSNNPAAAAKASQEKDALEQKYQETLSRREQELREGLVREYQPSEAQTQAKAKWMAACKKALDLSEPNSKGRVKSLAMSLEASTQSISPITPEQETLAASLDTALHEKLKADPDSLETHSVAAEGLLRLAEFHWIKATSLTADPKAQAMAIGEKFAREGLDLLKTTAPAISQQLAAALAGILEDTRRKPEALALQQQTLSSTKAPSTQQELVLRILARERQKAALARISKNPEEFAAAHQAAVKLSTTMKSWHLTLLSTGLNAQQSEVLTSQTETLAKLCEAEEATKAWAKVLRK